MSLLIVVPDRNNDKLVNKLHALLPDTKIEIWQAEQIFENVEFVLAWDPPSSVWLQTPNLKAISSYGAGVDGLLKHANLPDVPIARIVDPQLAVNMSEYILHAIGYFKLRFDQYLINKSSQYWKPKRAHSGNKVGILGLGELGAAVAQKLINNGFEVSGWSKSLKSIKNVSCYCTDEGLKDMLSHIDYLICLLPLTTHTQGILNKTIFNCLPDGAVLINVARGEHLNEHDFLAALDSGKLRGAALDVFKQEPLPPAHNFWQRTELLLTPHISAVTNIDTACAQIAENYLRLKSGKTLTNQINRKVGY